MAYFVNEKIMYAKIVAAMPPIPSVISDIIATAIRIYLSSLPFQFAFFIFNENIGTSLTNSAQNIIIIIITIDGRSQLVNISGLSTTIQRNEAVKMPVAVVVSPKKFSL